MASKLVAVLDFVIEHSEDYMLSALKTAGAVLVVYGIACMLRHGLPGAAEREASRLEAILGDDVADMVSDL